jgi:hypothetical protein
MSVDLQAIRRRLEESREFRANLQKDFWAELFAATTLNDEDSYSPRSHREPKVHRLSSIDGLNYGCHRHGISVQ